MSNIAMPDMLKSVFGVHKSPVLPPVMPVAPPEPPKPQVSMSMASKAQALAYGAGPVPKPPNGQAQQSGAPKVNPNVGTAPASGKAEGWGKTS